MEEGSTVCMICRDVLFDNETPLVSFPCGHICHEECGKASYNLSRRCPSCRKPGCIVRLQLDFSRLGLTPQQMQSNAIQTLKMLKEEEAKVALQEEKLLGEINEIKLKKECIKQSFLAAYDNVQILKTTLKHQKATIQTAKYIRFLRDIFEAETMLDFNIEEIKYQLHKKFLKLQPNNQISCLKYFRLAIERNEAKLNEKFNVVRPLKAEKEELRKFCRILQEQVNTEYETVQDLLVRLRKRTST
ncbi:hypothetical protein PCE1_004936 [Barthelona sp. PCE]